LGYCRIVSIVGQAEALAADVLCAADTRRGRGELEDAEFNVKQNPPEWTSPYR
jgi:hypothetical protein